MIALCPNLDNTLIKNGNPDKRGTLLLGQVTEPPSGAGNSIKPEPDQWEASVVLRNRHGSYQANRS